MVRIRLMRFGSKHRPYYRIVVVDSKKKRDGAYIESLGHYAPMEGKKLHIDTTRYNYWISVGAQPSATVSRLYNNFSALLK
ncbi:MAG: 30S ribosomal protein S16 [Brevinematia bacterium]